MYVFNYTYKFQIFKKYKNIEHFSYFNIVRGNGCITFLNTISIIFLPTISGPINPGNRGTFCRIKSQQLLNAFTHIFITIKGILKLQ